MPKVDIRSFDSYDQERFDVLSYSMSPSPKPYIMSNKNKQKMNRNDIISPNTAITNATSTTNTFSNKINDEIHENEEYDTFIPQPRASVVEKSFTWSDHNGTKQIPKPYI